MSVYILIGGGFAVLLGVVTWLAYRYGKANAQKEASKDEKDRMAENATISAEPYRDNPMDRM